MHPTIIYELAKLKIAEDHAYATRQRQAREAVREGPRSIDFGGLGERRPSSGSGRIAARIDSAGPLLLDGGAGRFFVYGGTMPACESPDRRIVDASADPRRTGVAFIRAGRPRCDVGRPS
jgi:hypothetical protein